MTDRIISADAAPGEAYDRALRPPTLSEFVGQSQAKGNLKVFIDAARGQGMTSVRVLRSVELPLAVPFILAGLRTTLVLAVGTATLSFLVDAGGLGIFIDTGYRLQDYTTLAVGSVLAVCLALFVDWLGGVGELLFNPKGLR